jgi:tetratricopeptide (TPR) repeat protein
MSHSLCTGQLIAINYVDISIRAQHNSCILINLLWISMGKIFFHQQKNNDAIACLEEALEIKKSILPDNHMSLAETRHLLGSLYIQRGDFAPVIPLLLSALVAYRGSQDCDVLKSDVLDLLGRAYAKTGDIDNAILSYEHSLKIKNAVVGTNSSPCSNVLLEIGKLKSLSNDVEGALIAFKEGDCHHFVRSVMISCVSFSPPLKSSHLFYENSEKDSEEDL